MPKLSIVIPVYNEAEILEQAVRGLHQAVSTDHDDFELIITENGSTDDTKAIANALAQDISEVRVLTSDEPNYGKALREGILASEGDFVACDEIDLCDHEFYNRALAVIERGEADMVVGSKAMKGAEDHRPLFRRTATKVINGMLRVAVGFKGTDTHGLKLFRREALLPIVNQCVVDRDLFASEFVIRAHRQGIAVTEIPVVVIERRRPAISLVRRVPHVLRGLATLTYHIRLGGHRE